MTWKPRAPGAYSPRRFTVDTSGEKIKQPRKKRATKQGKLFEDMTPDEQSIRNLQTATRQYKAKKAEIFSQARPISDDAWDGLGDLLGGCYQRSTLHRYIEFSCGLPSGCSTLNKFEKHKIWLTTQHMRRAMQMALHGENDTCRAIDELATSFGYEGGYFDALFSDLPPLT